MSDNETYHTVDKVNDQNYDEVDCADSESPTLALHKSPKAATVTDTRRRRRNYGPRDRL